MERDAEHPVMKNKSIDKRPTLKKFILVLQ
jgi:hypothetical protein